MLCVESLEYHTIQLYVCQCQSKDYFLPGDSKVDAREAGHVREPLSLELYPQ